MVKHPNFFPSLSGEVGPKGNQYSSGVNNRAFANLANFRARNLTRPIVGDKPVNATPPPTLRTKASMKQSLPLSAMFQGQKQTSGFNPGTRDAVLGGIGAVASAATNMNPFSALAAPIIGTVGERIELDKINNIRAEKGLPPIERGIGTSILNNLPFIGSFIDDLPDTDTIGQTDPIGKPKLAFSPSGKDLSQVGFIKELEDKLSRGGNSALETQNILGQIDVQKATTKDIKAAIGKSKKSNKVPLATTAQVDKIVSKARSGSGPKAAGGGTLRTEGGGSFQDSSGNDKIACTAMNKAYGFGSFRNTIWLKHSATMTSYHEKGYHFLFRPLIKHAYMGDKQWLRSILEHIARHRTIDIRAEMQNKKRDTIGRLERLFLEPLCYITGRILCLK